MKKVLILALSLILLTTTLNIYTPAEATTQAKVYVTIADKDGKLALVQESVNVTDTDNDGSLTLNDALFCAHELNFEGGAAAGYAYSQTVYGLSLDKLWGTANGGSYGYSVNNSSSTSLSDEIKEGDYITAYVYTDLVSWSDTYSFFNINTATIKENESVSLVLSAASFDQNWSPITIPVENAVITLNGEQTEFKTDAEGKVTVTVNTVGNFVISAVSNSLTLVPPVCKLTVAADETPAPEVSETPSVSTSPKTKTSANPLIFVITALLSVCAIAFLIKAKTAYEK